MAHFLVKNALARHSRADVLKTFRAIEQDVATAIRQFYRIRLPDGESADVLYFFWVKVALCPRCHSTVDLFSSYVFAQNAYPTKKLEAHMLCPHCGGINVARYDARAVTCSGCQKSFDPQRGPAHRTTATCLKCKHSFQIAKAVRRQGTPPMHRLYAKLVLLKDGTKRYLRADDDDQALYDEAGRVLRSRENAFPVIPIETGYNTDQVINYGYRYWHQMFNDRQLLCLSILATRIKQVTNDTLRELFTCLFSGVLEFNNMFASYKGEGTGAVRHMFSHHILKPERTPLEANLWGTPKSSGSFSTLFESRLLRALDYCEYPFEIQPVQKDGKIIGEKVYGLSCRLGNEIAGSYVEFEEGKSLYLSCGDSAHTDLDPESVEAVVTDPPFFDNVHYSQLADFFYVWQRHILGDNEHQATYTTRSLAEVQTGDSAEFAGRLRNVWAECFRVLRPNGLLIFTYHHSSPDGWSALLTALVSAGFLIVAAHPMKSEMSVAAPKSQAKEPIDLDVILVCRKRARGEDSLRLEKVISEATQLAAEQVQRFNRVGRALSLNDVQVVFMAQVLKILSTESRLERTLRWLNSQHVFIEKSIGLVYQGQELS